MVKISFWENDDFISDDKVVGTIVISGLTKDEIKELKNNYIVSEMAGIPKPHTKPAYWLRHSDEVDDCSRQDYFELCKEFGVEPDLSKIPGIVL